jgi:hypothetical protein
MLVKNLTQQTVIAEKVHHCSSLWKRLKGLLGTSKLDKNEACWLMPCGSIHTIGMRYAIDVLFLDKQKKVIAIHNNMRPNKFSPLHRGAHSVLELAAGGHNCQVGDLLSFEEEASASVKPSRHIKGQATLEFAICFVFYVILFWALTDTIVVLYTRSVLQFAANEVARKACTTPMLSDGPRKLPLMDSIPPSVKTMAQNFGVSMSWDHVHVYDLDKKPFLTTDGLGSPQSIPPQTFFIIEVTTTLGELGGASSGPLKSLEQILRNFTGASVGNNSTNLTVYTLAKTEPYS